MESALGQIIGCLENVSRCQSGHAVVVVAFAAAAVVLMTIVLYTHPHRDTRAGPRARALTPLLSQRTNSVGQRKLARTVLEQVHLRVNPPPTLKRLAHLRRVRLVNSAACGGQFGLESSDNATKATPPPRVITVGDALFDCIATDEARGFPIERVVAEGKWRPWPGGAPANVATALARLGTPSAFAGCVGADDDGDALVQLLDDLGVNTQLVQRTSLAPTRRVMVELSAEGDRSFAGFGGGRDAGSFADCFLDVDRLLLDSGGRLAGSSDDGASGWVDGGLLQGLAGGGAGPGSGRGWVVASTLSLAFGPSGVAVERFVNAGVDAGAALLVDINWRPVFWLDGDGDDSSGRGMNEQEARRRIAKFASNADVVKLTDEEAEWLGGITAADALADPDAVRALHFPWAEAVLVTAGEKGASWAVAPEGGMGGGVCGHVAPLQVSAVETTGAGDAFTAAFIHKLLSFDDECSEAGQSTATAHEGNTAVKGSVIQRAVAQGRFGEMVEFAAAAGALCCTRAGAIDGQPTTSDCAKLLAAHSTHVSFSAT